VVRRAVAYLQLCLFFLVNLLFILRKLRLRFRLRGNCALKWTRSNSRQATDWWSLCPRCRDMAVTSAGGGKLYLMAWMARTRKDALRLAHYLQDERKFFYSHSLFDETSCLLAFHVPSKYKSSFYISVLFVLHGDKASLLLLFCIVPFAYLEIECAVSLSDFLVVPIVLPDGSF